ncbi:MAG: LTA synthase family protein [Oscillospiraceae bacterium]|nr:LTA synthase family protein [Oscillospiraceae bacterium]MDD4368388.1 LTA synthase family protein [Oscillospiraceae bacterium]
MSADLNGKTGSAATITEAKGKQANAIVCKPLPQRLFSLVFFFLWPLGCFYLLESFMNDPWGISPAIQLANYLLYLGAELLLLVITGRQSLSARILLGLSYGIGLANYLVMNFRSTPIVPWDFNSFGTAVSVVSNYKFPFSVRFAVVSACLIAGMVGAHFLCLRFQRHGLFWLTALLTASIFMTGVVNLINYPLYGYLIDLDNTLFNTVYMYEHNGFMVSFLRNIAYLNVDRPEGYSVQAVEAIVNPYLDQEEADEKLDEAAAITETDQAVDSDTAAAGLNRSGSDSDLSTETTTTNQTETPEAESTDSPAETEASQAETEANPAETEANQDVTTTETTASARSASEEKRLLEAADESESEQEEEDLQTTGQTYQTLLGSMADLPLVSGADLKTNVTSQPNIIIVMNESFSDLSVLADFQTNIEVTPQLNSLSANTIKGDAAVSIKGGNTATSEFEFLTSDSMAFLPTGSVAYQQFISGYMPTLVQLLEDQDYYTIAMHPYRASGWNRDQVYPYFGFDKIKFASDFTNKQLLRKYISDASLFDEILLELQNKPADQSAFIFTVSMQNHGGYTTEYDNFEQQVEVTSDGGADALNQYLSLIYETDAAMGDFLSALEELDQDTIVLFFGDHQPNDYTVSSLKSLDSYNEAVDARYQVPYVIWANYDIPEGRGQTTSLNFLAGDLLDLAGLEKSPYLLFLDELQAQLPVMTANYCIDTEGTLYEYNGSTPFETWLNNYKILQYNQLIDRKNRVSNVFAIPQS